MKPEGIHRFKEATLLLFFLFLLSAFSKHPLTFSSASSGHKKVETFFLKDPKAVSVRLVKLNTASQHFENPVFLLSTLKTKALNENKKAAAHLSLLIKNYVPVKSPKGPELYYHLFSIQDDDLISES